MIAIIIISFLALIWAVYTIYIRQRASSDATSDHYVSPPRVGGLFDDLGSTAASAGAEHAGASKRRIELMERARRGDLDALSDARSTPGEGLYGDVLNTMVDWGAERQENLIALVSHISKSNELRANRRLVECWIELWKAAPNWRSTTEMINIAALSDDAATYQHAVEEVLEFWRRGKVTEFSAEELTELFVSHFWVIAPEARRGGEGFALKRKLSGARRELAAAAPAR
jgi:hypothetical protein